MGYSSRRRDFYEQLNENSIASYHSGFIPNVRYLTGFNGSAANLTMTNDGEAILVVDGRYDHYARQLSGEDLTIICYEENPIEATSKALQDREISQIHLERPNLSYNQFLGLKNGLGIEDRAYEEDRVAKARMCKTDAEIECIQRAVDKTLPVFDDIEQFIEPGKSEKEISRFIRSKLNARSEEHSFDPLVLIGDRTANPHCPTSGRELGEDDALLVDMGLRIDGYCSDLTRMFFLGDPDPAIREMYNCSKKAAEAAMDALEPGAVVKDIQQTAHDIIEDAGFVTKHALGHSVGLELHERPALTDSETVLEPGNIVTVEPGAYKNGVGGGRIEYMVQITQDGMKRLDQ